MGGAECIGALVRAWWCGNDFYDASRLAAYHLLQYGVDLIGGLQYAQRLTKWLNGRLQRHPQIRVVSWGSQG